MCLNAGLSAIVNSVKVGDTEYTDTTWTDELQAL